MFPRSLIPVLMWTVSAGCSSPGATLPVTQDDAGASFDAAVEPGDPCVPGPGRPDQDGDGVADDCDVCALGPDGVDEDGDGTPDACDACVAVEGALDTDSDGIPDDCDPCPIGSEEDLDGNGFPDACEMVLFEHDDAVEGRSAVAEMGTFGLSFGLQFCEGGPSAAGTVGRGTEVRTAGLNIFTSDNDAEWGAFVACVSSDTDARIYTSQHGWLDGKTTGSGGIPAGTPSSLGLDLRRAVVLYVSCDFRDLVFGTTPPTPTVLGSVRWQVVGYLRPS